MTSYNRISIAQIMDDLLDHPMLQDLSYERAINYVVEFIRIVGMPAAFEETKGTLPVENYTASIPADCYQILAIEKEGKTLSLNASPSAYGYDTNKDYTQQYTIRGDQIHTAFEEGELLISYLSLPTDEDGFPTIPDIASYIRALELYIKKKWFTVLFDLGKINASIYNNIKQEYAFAVGQAQNELVAPTPEEMEAITKMWNSLLPGKVGKPTIRQMVDKEELKKQFNSYE